MNLYFVNNGVEHPIDFKRSLVDGISVSIPYKELKAGEVFLRFEGMTLAS